MRVGMQAVENEYIGSPCGILDQIMIYFARDGMGTHFVPKEPLNKSDINYVPLGDGGEALRIVGLDTGTDRPGLEKSTYVVRKRECDELAAMMKESKSLQQKWATAAAAGATPSLERLADVDTEEKLTWVREEFEKTHPKHIQRLLYIFNANMRFKKLLAAWKQGDIKTVGQIFREDGHGLRDEYDISGPELQSMCDIVRTVDGVLGERMLGGGDKGASGALILDSAEAALRKAVDCAYPRSHPSFADKYAIHVVGTCDGIRVLDPALLAAAAK